MIVFISLYF